MHHLANLFFSIKFCEIFQGFIKKFPGVSRDFQGFPGLQKFPRVFQGPYEPCLKFSEGPRPNPRQLHLPPNAKLSTHSKIPDFERFVCWTLLIDQSCSSWIMNIFRLFGKTATSEKKKKIL